MDEKMDQTQNEEINALYQAMGEQNLIPLWTGSGCDALDPKTTGYSMVVEMG